MRLCMSWSEMSRALAAGPARVLVRPNEVIIYRCVLCVCVVLSLLTPAAAHAEISEAEPEQYEPAFDLGASFGSGFMRGGAGGLTTAQRSPFTVDVAVMGIRDVHWLLGGALRLELEDARAVAGIARVALRHSLGSLELRPGAGLPLYIAPRTMLGAEASLGLRAPMSGGFGIIAQLAASAFFLGNDVPQGSTVILFQLFLGIDLVI